MGFLKSRYDVRAQTSYSLHGEELLKILGINVDGIDSSRLGEITYFRCLKILSEAIAKLPLKIYRATENGNEKVKHYLNYILRIQPNSYYNANTFWSSVEFNRNHFGNAFVYIERHRQGRNAGKVKALWILPNTNVQIIIDNKGVFGKQNALWYQFNSRSGEKYIFKQNEVLHFKSWITQYGEGLVGLAVKDILQSYIEKGQYSNKFVTNLTKNGMVTDKIIIHYTGNLEPKAEKALVEELEMYSKTNSGKFIPLPLGFTATNLSSKLTDSQFLELNKYNALQIASAFGITPQYVNDFDKGNYANVGLQQESMYKDTLLPILSNYEQELAIKLFTQNEKNNGYYFNFNVDAILRSAFKTRIDTYATAINNGILTPNECRTLENRSAKEGGDELIGNGNYMPLKMAGIQWSKGGD